MNNTIIKTLLISCLFSVLSHAIDEDVEYDHNSGNLVARNLKRPPSTSDGGQPAKRAKLEAKNAAPKKVSSKLEDLQNYMREHVFHGIGTDVTVLSLICKNGILSREYAESNGGSEGFVQKWGVNGHKKTGGINGQSNISVSSAYSPAYLRHSLESVSIMIAKNQLNGCLSQPYSRGAEEGEMHVTGGVITPLQFKNIVLQKNLASQLIGYGLGKSLLSGSSDLNIKVDGFLQRLNILVGHIDFSRFHHQVNELRALTSVIAKKKAEYTESQEEEKLFIALVEKIAHNCIGSRFNVTKLGELIVHEEFGCSSVPMRPLAFSLMNIMKEKQ